MIEPQTIGTRHGVIAPASVTGAGVLTQPSSVLTPQFWPAFIAAVTALSTVAIIGVETYREIKGEKHHSIHGPERVRLVRQYGTWAVGRAEAVCPEDDVECVREEAYKLFGTYRKRYVR